MNVPLTASVPDQAPLAAQEVAFWLVQLSTELAPAVMVLGVAVSPTVGAGPD